MNKFNVFINVEFMQISINGIIGLIIFWIEIFLYYIL